MRVFFGEQHGKSPCNSLFSCIKKQLNTFIFKRNSRLNQNPFIMCSAHDVFQVCKTHLENTSSYTEKGHKALTFHYVTTSQLHQGFDPSIDTVEGTKSFHAVRSCGEPLALETRTVGCTCKVYITHSKDKCENSSVTDAWVRHELIPTNHPLTLYDIKKIPEFPL